jgi:hypothetical protein
MSHDEYDDGLVHSHSAWCSERGAPRHAERRDEVGAAMAAHPEQIEHDDGLVHDHGWACGERGAMLGAD